VLKFQEKLKPPQTDGVVAEPGSAAPAEAAKPEKPFLAAGGSRTTSKGSLLNPEAGSSMASTVMDMVSRKQATPSAAAGAPTTTAATAAAEQANTQRKASSSSSGLYLKKNHLLLSG
jgi:hypothetical protein